MSLNFDYSRIKDSEVVTTHPDDVGKDPTKEKVHFHPVFDSVVWRTMAVGIGEITEDNVDEFYWRVRLLHLIDGSGDLLSGAVPGGKIYLTREDIALYVGLSTNVPTTKSRDTWVRKLFSRDRSRARQLPPVDQSASAYELTAQLCRQAAEEEVAEEVGCAHAN